MELTNFRVLFIVFFICSDLNSLMNLRQYIGTSDFTTLNDDIKHVFGKLMLYKNEQFTDLQKAIDDIEEMAYVPTEYPTYRSLRDLLGVPYKFVFDFYFNRKT